MFFVITVKIFCQRLERVTIFLFIGSFIQEAVKFGFLMLRQAFSNIKMFFKNIFIHNIIALKEAFQSDLFISLNVSDKSQEKRPAYPYTLYLCL